MIKTDKKIAEKKLRDKEDKVKDLEAKLAVDRKKKLEYRSIIK